MRAKDHVSVFLNDELLNCEIYRSLAAHEKNRKLKGILAVLSETEGRHAQMWRNMLDASKHKQNNFVLVRLTLSLILTVRRFLGAAFILKLMERNEIDGLKKYGTELSERSLGPSKSKVLESIMRDEKEHERILANTAMDYESELGYTQSVILGLNDGLVEILAVVAGLASVANTSFIVVILGFIAGISGTLSMAGGVYLSAKSEGLVESVTKEKRKYAVLPSREAYYTGICYFIASLLPILPFILGLKGAVAVMLAILLVSAALIIASTIIAVISGTSIRKRAFEMLVISLGAAFVTMLFGTFSKAYLGVSI